VSTPVTRHFAVEEFHCHDGTPYPSVWIDERLRPLCSALEALREELGGRAMPAYLTWVKTSTGSPTSKLSGTKSFSGSPIFAFETRTEIRGAPSAMGSRLRNRRLP
jgi:hypothetical protein